jgi:hypothetical protein
MPVAHSDATTAAVLRRIGRVVEERDALEVANGALVYALRAALAHLTDGRRFREMHDPGSTLILLECALAHSTASVGDPDDEDDEEDAETVIVPLAAVPGAETPDWSKTVGRAAS